jgi:DNA-binding winged helix-turn-helix (wHTH) protein/Tol biopolymer transport system component
VNSFESSLKRIENVYAFGHFVLDPARRLLVRDGDPIPLTPKAFDTLVILVERRDEVMSKDDLLQLLWPDVVVEESNLSQQISHLRRALDDEASEPRYIVTLPKRGYRFVAAVTQTDSAAQTSLLPAWVRRSRSMLAALLGAGLAVAVLASIVMLPRPPDAAPVRFAIEPPPGSRFTFVALSPDGARLVFSARDTRNDDQLWIRSLDALESRALEGTEGGVNPFWSPDSRHVGFFAHGKLKTIDVLGGPPQSVCDAPNPRGGSWSREDVIVFAPDSRSALLRVAATGGQTAPATHLDPASQAGSHRFPYFLPDGRHFLYLQWSGQADTQGVWVGSIDSRDTIRLVDANSSAAYASPGYLLFVRGENLMGQQFDVERLVLRGHPFSVANGLGRRTNNYAAFTISERGALAYHAVDYNMRLVWFDRSGRELGTVAIPPARLGDPAISPDGSQVLVSRQDPDTETPDLYLSNEHGLSRVTSHPGVDVLPVWSPDAAKVVYRSNRNGPGDLYVKPLVGAGDEELLVRNTARKDPTDWSPDGRFILYDNFDGDDPSRESDMWILPMFGDRRPSQYQRKTFSAWGGRFSPDGRWVAYASDEHGKGDVYIQAFPANGISYRVSKHGGWQPAWRRDGRELFYLANDGMLMAAAIHVHDDAVDVGEPVGLFRPTVRSTLLRNHYDVAPNGDRFLVNTPVQDEATAPLTVVLNWTATLPK